MMLALLFVLRKLNPLKASGLDVQERPRPGSRHSSGGEKFGIYKGAFSFLVMLSVCFPDLGFQVAGQSGQSGACVMKRASNTAAVTARYTAQTLLSASETARSTKIACIMKFLVCTVSLRRERVGQFRRAARAQTVKLGWDFLYYKLGLDASRKTSKQTNMWQAQGNWHTFKAA